MNIEKTTAYLMDLVDDYRDTDKKCGSFTYNETTAKARDVLINGLREVLQCKACPVTLEGYSPSGVAVQIQEPGQSTHEQQAQAWRAVWEVLQEVKTGFDDCYPLSGQEAAVKAIRELVSSDAPFATHPTQQGLEQFIEKAGDVHFQRCRVGSAKGALRWDIEFGHYGAEVSGKTLQEAIAKALAAQAKQGGV